MLCLQLSEVAYKSSELSSGLRGIKQNSKTQHSAKLVPFILSGRKRRRENSVSWLRKLRSSYVMNVHRSTFFCGDHLKS